MKHGDCILGCWFGGKGLKIKKHVNFLMEAAKNSIFNGSAIKEEEEGVKAIPSRKKTFFRQRISDCN